MSFVVELFNFSKKENSTKQPDRTSATSFNCTLKKDSGLLNPIIQLDIGLSQAPNYNYAYIPAYDRYYFVKEWVNRQPLWEVALQVDVLATFKTSIGNSDLYVLRASNAYDGNIVDNMYPTKTNISASNAVITRPHNVIQTGGGYVCGIVGSPGSLGGSASRYGSLYYIYITRAGLNTLCNYLMDSANYGTLGFLNDDASFELQKGLVDPLSYIKSAVWLPYNFEGSIISTALTINGWSVPGVEYVQLGNLKVTDTKSVSLTLTRHPDTASRGNYMNTKPYTNIWLNVQPYGAIELDTTITANNATVTLTENLDFITGKGILTVTCGNSVLAELTAQIGVPVSLSQITRDYISAYQADIAGASGVASGIASFSLSGIIGGIAGAGVAVGSATQALAPKLSSTGGGGGFIDVNQPWYINYQFLRPVDDDITHNGRPLCQIRKPNVLNGYMLIQDGDIDATGATADELQSIRAYLEGGFYYE